MPYLQYLGLDGREEGNWHVLMEQAPVLGAQSHVQSLTNTLYLLVADSVTGKHMSVWMQTILTKYQPLGEDSDGKSPSFL